MTIDETDSQLIEHMLRMEREASEIAMNHIAEFHPFANLPPQVNARLLHDFQRIGQAKGISKTQMLVLLAEDINTYLTRLRSHTLNHVQIGSVRLAVLVHVAVAIGADETIKIPGLSAALRDCRFEDAADCLMMSRWPMTATEADDRKRILELARMMRTGTVPTAWLH